MPDRFDLTIGGVAAIVRVGTLKISETLGGRNTLTCQVLSLDAATRYDIGAEVLLTDAEDGGDRTFGGNISMPSEHAIDDQLIEEFAISVSAVAFNAIPERRTVIGGGIPAGFTLKQGVVSLAGYLTSYGVTVDPAQVNGPLLPLMQYDIKRVSAWYDEFTVITGYVRELDYNKVLRFIEPGTQAAPFFIADDDGNTVGDIVVEPSDVDYANRIIVLAGEGQREVTEPLTFNGTDDFIDLTYTLVGHRGYLTVNGSNETLGGSPAIWVFDPLIPNRIKREAGAPAAGTGEIIYTAQFPYYAQADDLVEQAGPRGIVDDVITKTDVFDATLAQALANGYLIRRVIEPRTVKFATHRPGLHPGQTIAIQSSVRDISLIALITEVSAQDLDGETMRYDVTAVEGDIYTGSWRDLWRTMANGGGASSSAATGPITVVTSGGVGGSGTPGTLAQWTTSATIGDATAVPAALLTGTIAAARLPQFTGGHVTSSGAGSVTLNIGAGVITDTHVNASAAIGWTKISKTGSSLADLTTRSAGDLTSGNLAYARMPSGSGTWTASPTISGDLTAGADIDPLVNYTSNLGNITHRYLTAHIAELWVTTLVAQDVISTIGGEIIVAPTTELIADFGSGATTIDVKHSQIANGDRLWMEKFDGASTQVEFIAVTSGSTPITGGFRYSVTRNLDGSGANNWVKGDAVVNTGTTGDGLIHLYATNGVFSGSGPTIVGLVRTGTTYNNLDHRWAIGNLNGLYGYVADIYGAAFGDPANAWLKIDAVNGIRIGHNTTTKIALSSSGNASFASGGVTVDQTGISVTPNSSNVWSDATAYRFVVSTGELGLHGFNDSGASSRGLSLVAKWTGSGDYTPTIALTSQNAPSVGGTAWAATLVNGWLSVEGTFGLKASGGALYSFSGTSGSTFRIEQSNFVILNTSLGATKFKVTASSGATEWGGGVPIASSSQLGIQSFGSASVPNNSATSLFVTGAGLYIVFAYVAANNYNAWAVVSHDGTQANLLRTDSNTANFALSRSGSTVQATQLSGGTVTVNYSHFRIG